MARASVELGSTVLPEAMSGKLSEGKSPSGPAPRPVFFKAPVVLREEKKAVQGRLKPLFSDFQKFLKIARQILGQLGVHLRHWS